MTTTRRTADHAELTASIERETAEFLANGGEIVEIPYCTTTADWNQFNNQRRGQAQKRARGMELMQRSNAKRARAAAARKRQAQTQQQEAA